jgi:hypothetical protein
MSTSAPLLQVVSGWATTSTHPLTSDGQPTQAGLTQGVQEAAKSQ